MNEKTCNIIVTTIDNQTIMMKCTPDYLEKVKTILNESHPLMKRNVSNGDIRLWKLGKSEQQIIPTAEVTNKLLDILKDTVQSNGGGGVTDIVWDDMIDLQVEYPPRTPEFIFLGENMIIRVDMIKSIILNVD